MHEIKDSQEEQNFWISYADLMAGLLFVFILVLGVIVIKYVYIQENLLNTKTDLMSTNDSLSDRNRALRLMAMELENIQSMFSKSKKENEELTLDLQNQNNILSLSTEKIKKITQILNDKNDEIELLNTSMKNQKILIKDKIKSLEFSKSEISKMKDLLLGYELKEKKWEDDINKLKDNINESNNIITLKQGELSELTDLMLKQSKAHQLLVNEFDITKVKIKRLTGIKIKVIQSLKRKLGSSINIDEKSGAIKFSSNILFDQNKYELKENSKKELSKTLTKYIHTLLVDENIRKYIDSIMIEGHTNSAGTYIHNLELSQKRALEVMKFLYLLNFKDKKLLEKYIGASGKSYSDLILDKQGKENKNASRRIEIKFRIKNEEVIKELSNYLDKK